MILNSIKILDLKFDYNIFLEFYLKIKINITNGILTSILSLDNKSLIISVFSFSIAINKIVSLKYEIIS